MKKIMILLCVLFTGIAVAETINITWHNADGTTYDTTTCDAGGTLVLPTAPIKRGYTFLGWSKYTPIEYIEFTGTQQITIPIATTNYVHGKIGFIPTSGGNTSYNLAGNGDCSLLYNRSGNRYNLWLNGNFFSSVSTPLGTYGDVEYICSVGLKSLTVDGVSISGTNTVEIIVSSMRFNSYSQQALYGRVYYYQLLDKNDNLLLDIIPVRDQDGVPCVYDRVTGRFFYNSGTGNFIAGPVIE